MKTEARTSVLKVERNTTGIVSEFDLFISACEGVSAENIRYSEWGLSICVTVGQRGCEIERVESMRIGDVVRYKGRNDSLFEVRLLAIDTGGNKYATFEVSELS